jgi:hypothetical protein
LPGTAKAFRRWRPRDLVVELGVSPVPGLLEYHMFNEPALNTFDGKLAAERDGLGNYKMTKTKMIRTDSLAAILDAHAAVLGDGIDFLSVDAEGMDLDVLRSNDWGKFRPGVVVAECLHTDIIALTHDPVLEFMGTVGYVPYAKTGQSVIFIQPPAESSSQPHAQ